MKLIGSVKGNFSLVLIFYSLATIYFAFALFNAAPKFYSNARPNAMNQMWDKPNGENRYYEYSDAFNNFLEHRQKQINNKK